MPLMTFADLQAPAKSNAAKKVFELVSTRIHDTKRPMPPPGNAKPEAAELAAIDAWVAASAPISTSTCAATGVTAKKGPSPLECPAGSTLQHVRPTKKFLMGQTSDEYTCFTVDAAMLRGNSSTDKKHAISFGPHIDNPKIVHHIILFQIDGSTEATNTEPSACGSGAAGSSRFVAGWAPGGGNYEMPKEAGFPQEGNSKYRVQVHLNNQQGLVGEEDASGFDMCVAAPRANDADVMATGSIGFQLPPRTKIESACDYTWNKNDVHIFGASPHMHRLGTSLNVIKEGDSGKATVLDAPNFDFSVGGGGAPVNLQLKRGEKLHTTCGWNNTGDSTVKFGESTGDEMCFAFLMYYPRVDLKSFAIPAALSRCTSTTK